VLKDSTVAIQGYGNAGQHAHRLVTELFGAKVVALSDSKGGVFNEAGIAFKDAMREKEADGTVAGARGTYDITNETLLEQDVDILIPAAIENQIRADNAARVKATVILELANGPTTPDADAILQKKKVHVIPDFLANAGGVTVSYFEWVQNLYNYYWDVRAVHEQLDKKMTAAYDRVFDVHKQQKCDMRTAAYIVAVGRVAEAVQLRGLVDA
jgi:glutamate dehydrogenase (NAD(P)+)